MFKVQFQNFRCFTKNPAVEIRPITLLVGENSAGKTSFLAGLRFLFESFIGNTQNVFNRDPYFLGGFDEIAHRKGMGRPASEFAMRIEVPSDNVIHEFKFNRGEPQPELSGYEFRWQGHRVTVNLLASGGTLKVEIQEGSDEILEIGPDSDPQIRLPPIPFLKNNISYLSMVFENLRYQIASSRGKKGTNTKRIPEQYIAQLAGC